MCDVCSGKSYLISERDDGRRAIERCDACSYHGENDPRTLTDGEASLVAEGDGIKSTVTYPHYVITAWAAK